LAAAAQHTQRIGLNTAVANLPLRHPLLIAEDYALIKERNQLLFGTPGDLIQLIEQYQASVDSRHFVFWLDFGGMKHESVRRSMQLLAQEVIPHLPSLQTHLS